MIYGLVLNITKIDASNANTPTNSPFNITIKYNNTIYPQNDFTIGNSIKTSVYKVRSDLNKIEINQNHSFIYLTEPIIANKITFIVEKVSSSLDQNTIISLKINDIKVIGKMPQDSDISDYKRTVNMVSQSSTSDSSSNTNVCPSINELINTQTKTQSICDNLEYQDKVKSEKLRLERNKQYLLKLKDQQEQVDQLNIVIQDLENKRQARAKTNDQVRVLQYQKQKADASTIRDLANQRFESQDKNKLYMDVKINN